MDLYLNIKCNIFVNLIEAACQNTIEMNTSAFHILLTAVELLIIEPLLAANESVVRGKQKTLGPKRKLYFGISVLTIHPL